MLPVGKLNHREVPGVAFEQSFQQVPIRREQAEIHNVGIRGADSRWKLPYDSGSPKLVLCSLESLGMG